ncbi:ribosomal protein S18 acetylase RimI-like enzyme [Panacagrimonas perspica]|uniref:Ribosomal protein S18 acetylase RimI-like enzyme n=1 Tax=Panacagrimonas perspica TaxID=381431 RepID=A0A4R7NTM1_9GAMM|nr:GNAT family N-acetyltransferase [Panacagrimonas perspica]TDU24445.1 ribosomal protein S18 acetylase RimI-like enzyme [Panacagrimonas perspica]
MERLIRPMQARDIPACLELWREVEGIVLRDESDNAPALETFLARTPDLSFVAEDGPHIIGSILCGHDGRRAHVYHLAVRQGLRRARCATALFNASLEAIRAQGITRCHAYVRARNLTALKFWSSVEARLRRDIHVVTLQIDPSALSGA